MKEDVSLLGIVEQSFKRFVYQENKKITIDLALSGGQDSMALLFTLKELSNTYTFTLRAIHVNHGISPNADDWLKICQAQCQKLEIEFISSKISLDENHPLGTEGQARKLRYASLDSLKKGILVTAHHQQDQAETFFLQFLRGSGLRGLSSMQEFDASRLLWRPLLTVNQDLIKDYLSQKNIVHVDDESNSDDKYDRNFLRNNIFPELQKRFPQAIKTINRSVDLIAEGFRLNQILAEKDFHQYLTGDNNLLKLAAFEEIERERLHNLLRWWLNINDLQMPSQKIISEVVRQVLSKKNDALIKIKITELVSIRTYQKHLYLVKTSADENFEITWSGEQFISLPDMSTLYFNKQKGQGFNFKKISSKKLVVRSRLGGEKFKPIYNQPTRTLKSLLQDSKIPPWERAKIPLVMDANKVVAIPGFGVDFDYQVSTNEFGYSLSWDKSTT